MSGIPGTDIVPSGGKQEATLNQGSFVMPSGRRLSRVDSKTLRESYKGNEKQAVSTDEVESILRNLDRKDNKIKYNRRMRIALLAAIGFMAVMVGAMFVVTYAANEQSKETHAKGGVLTNKAGTEAIATDTVKSYGNILGFPCLPMDILQNMDEVALEVEVSKTLSSDGLMDVVLKVGTVNRFEEDKRVDVKSPSNQQQLSVQHGQATYKDEDNCAEGCKVVVSLDVATGRRLTTHHGAVDRSLTASPPRQLGSFATFRQMAKIFKQACEAFKSVGTLCDAAGLTSDNPDTEVKKMCKDLKDVSVDDRIECNKDTKATFTPKEILGATDVLAAYGTVFERCNGAKYEHAGGRQLKGGRKLLVDYGWCSTNGGFALGFAADSSNYCSHQTCDSWVGCGSSLSSCCIAHDKCLQSNGAANRCPDTNCNGASCDRNLCSCNKRVSCSYKFKCGWWKCWGYDVNCGWATAEVSLTMCRGSNSPQAGWNTGGANC